MSARKRIFVCVQNRPAGHPRGSCQMRSATAVYQTFFEELRARGLSEYHLTTAGCLGPCADGPNVLVYPGGILYGHVTPDDVAEIVAEHLVAGRPVERLVRQDAMAP